MIVRRQRRLIKARRHQFVSQDYPVSGGGGGGGGGIIFQGHGCQWGLKVREKEDALCKYCGINTRVRIGVCDYQASSLSRGHDCQWSYM